MVAGGRGDCGGPRGAAKSAMVRLTPELVGRSPQFVNCLGDRELDLRGNQISVIENLATSNDQFDVLDLTDNIIALLANFPQLRRLKVRPGHSSTPLRTVSCIVPPFPEFPLKTRWVRPALQTLLAGNNKIARIGSGFAKSLPNLESLVLVGNQLTTLRDLDELSKLPKLHSLVLNENPVAKEKHYRLYLVDKVRAPHGAAVSRVPNMLTSAAV